MEVNAVLFDLFETLVTESSASVVRAGSLAGRLGLDPDAYRIEWRRRRPDVLLGRSSFRAALKDTASALGSSIPDATLDDICSERVRSKATVLQSVEPIALQTLRALRHQGVKLGLVSNCFAEDVARWPTSPLAPLFDDAVFSFAVGVAKPDLGIYHAACRNFCVQPEQALFVGDGGDDELAGARRAGLHPLRALWFRRRSAGAGREEAASGLRSIDEVLAAIQSGAISAQAF